MTGGTRWRTGLRLAAIVVALALLTGCSPYGSSPQEEVSRSPFPVGMSEHTIRIDNQVRTYRTYRPHAGNRPVPLVVMLHGAGGTGKQAADAYGWIPEADAGNFVVAFPDGHKRAWHVNDQCCGAPALEGIDDLSFIQGLVKEIRTRLPIDPNRIYITGISNGGLLAYQLACETTLFAAVGAVATTMIGDCPSPAPVSLLHIHGTGDQTIPYGGGPGRRDNGGTGSRPVHIDGPAIPDLAAHWRTVDSCPEPRVVTTGMVTKTTADCPDNRAVELITIADAGHQWPGSKPNPPWARQLLNLDPPSTALNATRTIWLFFDAHPKPGSN